MARTCQRDRERDQRSVNSCLANYPSVYTAISRKVVGKNVHATIPKGNVGYDQYTVPDTVAVEPTFVKFIQHSQTYVHDLSCHSFKFLWKTVNSRPPTIHFAVVACTLSDNLSRNSCIHSHTHLITSSPLNDITVPKDSLYRGVWYGKPSI